MAARLRILLGQMHRLTNAGPVPFSDADLLQQFVAGRDAAAFEVLVWRHGAMVFNLCQNICRGEQDAEDAFQATFLALARSRKRSAVVRRSAVGFTRSPIASQSERRQTAATRAVRERPLTHDYAAAAEADCPADLRNLVRDELFRLPEKYQRPLFLFHFEGKSLDEIAHELGCPVGTAGSRRAARAGCVAGSWAAGWPCRWRPSVPTFGPHRRQLGWPTRFGPPCVRMVRPASFR